MIAKAGEPMARLVSLAPEPQVVREPGQWKGQVWMADDFDTLPPDILAAFYGEDDNADDPLRWPVPKPNDQ